jgi:hypothetical protein
MKSLQSPVSRRALIVGALLIGALALVSGARATSLAGSLGWYDDQNEPRKCDELTAANPGLSNPNGGEPCNFEVREDQEEGYNSLPVCQDNVDNDSDELTDCADPDCFQDPACGGGEWCNVESAQFAGQQGDCGGDDGVNKCQDGLDNDSDGLFDCADPDCAFGRGTWSQVCDYHGDPVCAEYTCYAGNIGQDEWSCGGNCAAEKCWDGQDNDGNGEFDCADPACSYQDVCQVQPENDESRCSDGQDNDRDGSYDCSDSDCSGTSTCWWAWSGWNPGNWWASYETDCGNGSDDDNDGAYDCADPDCSADYRCSAYTNPTVAEHSAWGYYAPDTFCGNGSDDDGDGYVDCADPDCSSASNCQARPCAQTEQDADGNCAPDYAYYGPVCADGYDNDQDGLYDCADSDCASDPVCTTVTTVTVSRSEIAPDGVPVAWLFGNGYCVDGYDNDANGLVDCWDIACAGQDPVCDYFGGLGATGWPYDWRYQNGDPRGSGVAGINPTAPENSGTGSPTTGFCGDGSCDSGEDSFSCPSDCGYYRIAENPDCSDGVDNDSDGFTDCSDSDCATTYPCGREWSCSDLQDNNGDGRVDCEDPDCITDPACNPEPPTGGSGEFCYEVTVSVADLENAVNWNGDPQPNAVQAIANATGISFETLWTFLANARLAELGGGQIPTFSVCRTYQW